MAKEDLEYETDRKYYKLVREAEEYYQSFQLGKAISIYKQILKLRPNSCLALCNLTDIFFKLNLNAQTEKYTSRSYYIHGDDTSAVNYSCSLIGTKKYNKVIKILEKCKKNDSDDYLVYNNLGYTYFLKGKYLEALDNYNISIALCSHNPLAYCNRGILKYFVFDDQDGIIDLKQADRYGDLEAKIILMGILKPMFN